MILAADEIARSLSGVWDLLNRRAQGLKRFDFAERSLWRSFTAPLLVLPALVVFLAAERLQAGVAAPGAQLLDDPSAVLRTLGRLAALWLTLPMLAVLLADRLRIRGRLVPFIIVCNWASVMAAAMLAVPALLFAVGWATSSLAALYMLTAAVIIMQMRWFVTRITLGLTGGVAALLALADGMIGVGLLRLVA